MNKKLKSFTMAEILLSLTIIGVVAAITLPSLTGNINERTWNTQRKALYARMSQAIPLMGSLNGYGQYAGTWEADSVTVTVDTAAKAFITDGLSKVLKINNICDNAHLDDCGINSTYITMSNSRLNFPTKMSELNIMFISTYREGSSIVMRNAQSNIDTKAVAFETQNGESILVFYNPFCTGLVTRKFTATIEPKPWNTNAYIYSLMCANFIYDLNGKKGPNTVGKDIGVITAIYPSDSVVVAPLPLAADSKNSDGNITMSQSDANRTCSAQGEDIRLPNIEELNSMFYNSKLLNFNRGWYWSVSHDNADYTWAQSFTTGNRQSFPKTRSDYLHTRCVKR